jgi:hypothetical protein
MKTASQADNLIQGMNSEEFVAYASKQLAGMVFALWLDHLDSKKPEEKAEKDKKLNM